MSRSPRSVSSRRRRAASGLVLVLAAGALPAAGARAATSPACIDPDAPGPWFRALRYDERFCDRAMREDDPWWLALKNLGDEGRPAVSLGGELRVRHESVRPVNAGLRGGRDDGYTTYRALVHADVRFTEQWRVFTQLGYWNSAGREPRPSPTDLDRGDIQQLFVEWRGGDGTWLRAGRQEALYGGGRLIGLRALPNIRSTYDGARIGTRIGRVEAEVFHLRPVSIDDGAWNNREDSRERFAGVYLTRPGTWSGLALEGYAFRFERAFQRYQNGAGRERRDIVGTRIAGTVGRFTLNHELTLQGGDVGGQSVRAWSLQTESVWHPAPDARWGVGLKVGTASGDDDPDDGRLETFQPIGGPPPYFMQSALLFPANLTVAQPFVEWRASPALTLTFEAQAFWRREREDGFYQPPGIVQRLDASGYRLGSQFGANARWTVRRDFVLEAAVTTLRPTGALARAGAEDTTFASAMATWSF